MSSFDVVVVGEGRLAALTTSELQPSFDSLSSSEQIKVLIQRGREQEQTAQKLQGISFLHLTKIQEHQTTIDRQKIEILHLRDDIEEKSAQINDLTERGKTRDEMVEKLKEEISHANDKLAEVTQAHENQLSQIKKTAQEQIQSLTDRINTADTRNQELVGENLQLSTALKIITFIGLLFMGGAVGLAFGATAGIVVAISSCVVLGGGYAVSKVCGRGTHVHP